MTKAAPQQPDPVTLLQAQALYQQVEGFIATQNYDEALVKLKEAIAILETPDGYYWLGVLYNFKKDAEAAEAAFEDCLRMNADYFQAHAELAKIKMEAGAIIPALEHYRDAYKSAPDNLLYGVELAGFLQKIRLWRFQPPIKDLILFCLKQPKIDGTMLGRSWLSIIKTDPAFKPLKKLLKQKKYKAFEKVMRSLKDKSFLNEEFLLLGLSQLTIADIDFEKTLTFMRRYALLSDDQDVPLPFLSALATYCYNNEYIFFVEDEEQRALAALTSANARDLLIKACFGNPFEGEAADIDDESLDVIKQQHIEMPKALGDIKGRIEALTPIDDNVSGAVREQYEVFPYPRWEHFIPALKDSAENHLREDAPHILIAGCGTGLEAVELASALPESKVTAIDLSLSSLSYAIFKAQQHSISNITFGQADILKLGDWSERYDYIVSSGVLHHMDNPAKGLQILTGLLKKGGQMRLAFYSKLARRHVTDTQNLIKDKNYGDDAESMRQFRREMPMLLDKKAAENILNFRDYYLMSECRDLLFHVHERCYDIPTLKGMLSDAGLQFIKFYQDEETWTKYWTANPSDPAGKDLDNWHDLEEKNPDMFAGMYRFWVQKI